MGSMSREVPCTSCLTTSCCVQAAEQLFRQTAERDGSTYNAMILAAGLAWRPYEGELHLQHTMAGGFGVLSSSYCALIAAYWCALVSRISHSHVCCGSYAHLLLL